MKKVTVELNEREVLKRILNENEVIVVDHIDQRIITKNISVKL